MYTCPVCAYDRLRRPPEDFVICPSCGTEFGYDDFAVSHKDLREQWIAAGAPWFSHAIAAPQGWDANAQMVRGGLLPTINAVSIGSSTSTSNVSFGNVEIIYFDLEPTFDQEPIGDVQYVDLAVA